jgi:hypothetical protein
MARKAEATPDYELQELRKVVGAKLVEVRREEDWPVLIFDNGLCIMIQCDPEGNGPGFGALCKV